jgi:capsular exopolysaccharide synthesis family protein
MEIENQNYIGVEDVESDFDFKTIAFKYIHHWKWILLSISIALVIAAVKVKKTKPLYNVTASIVIKSGDKQGLEELAALKELGLNQKGNNIQNEIELFKSRTLMKRVVQELKLHISYIQKRRSYNIDMYNLSPISIDFINDDSALYDKYDNIRIEVESVSSYNITDENGTVIEKKKFGSIINTAKCGKARILCNSLIDRYIGKILIIQVSPIDDVINRYKNSIAVEQVSKTNVLILSMTDESKQKAIDIINNIIKQHDNDGINDKNVVSQNTARFINERIKYISEELSTVEGNVEEFKESNKLVDVQMNATSMIEGALQLQPQIFETSIKYNLVNYMEEYLHTRDSEGDFIPENLIDFGTSGSTIISQYNQLLLSRNRLLKYSSLKNPVVVSMDERLVMLKNEIEREITDYKKSLKFQLDKLKEKEGTFEDEIAKVPKQERVFRDVQRQQQIKETLFLFLLQKREETNIALAITVGDIKVIDSAYSDGANVAVKKNKVYTQAFLIGLLIPLLIIYILGLLDNKVHGRNEIDKLKIPFAGDLPYTESKDKIVVSKTTQSSIAEAFRLMRTNIGFMLKHNQQTGHTIFITSTIAQEGKSFVSLNLASIIANTGKKVVLVGMDLRAPKVLQYFGIENNREGVTNYISNLAMRIEDVIIKAPNIEHLDLLPSGAIPPNPAELLMDERVKDMFETLRKQYDYIIVDTAPVGLVTDTLIFSKYADLFLYVVRANFLDKKMLGVAKMLYNEKKLTNMAVVLNGTTQKGGTYGYGYGYGYGQETEKKNILKKIFQK